MSLTRFVIQPDRSTVFIEARSSLHPIHSETSGLEGYLDLGVLDGGGLDTSGDSAGHLELNVDQLSSGNGLYDREMQRRIEAHRFPTIAGDLTDLSENGSAGSYVVKGDLSFHGVTLALQDRMKITVTGRDGVHLEGAHVFDVRDFGIEPPKIMMLKVHPDVTVRVDIMAEAAAAAATGDTEGGGA